MKKVVTIGEILLRFSTEQGKRFSQSTELEINLGGAEYNVAINMANFGYEATLASIVPQNPLGEMTLENLARYKVKTDFVEKKGERLGTYYLENGSAMKAPRVVYDRTYSSFATSENAWNLSSLFEDVSLLHISGITLALSDYWLATIIRIMHFAKEHGVKISFDMNYRAKLWDIENAKKAYQKILPLIDYCSAGQRDAVAFFDVDNDVEDYFYEMKRTYPNIELFYAANRTVISSSHHKYQGVIWKDNNLYTSESFDVYPIVDRVGTGDAYTAGVLHGILSNISLNHMVEFATVSAVLKHSIKGDVSMYKIEEIEEFLSSGSFIIR